MRTIKQFLRISVPLICTATLDVGAATIEPYCPKLPDGKLLPYCHVLLSGKIESGDAEKLRRVVANPPAAGVIFQSLMLNSRGGDVAEAMKLGDVVRKAMLRTTNMDLSRPGGYPCVSACVLVLMSGVTRKIATWDDRLIGLHRPYFAGDAYRKSAPNAIAGGQSEIMQRLRAYLQGEGMASDLIDKMMRHSSRDIYWVNGAEWEEKVPAYAPWYEEMLIAGCGWKSDRRRELDRAKEDEATFDFMRLWECERNLTNSAQESFRAAKGNR